MNEIKRLKFKESYQQPKLPPSTFNTDYTFDRGYSGKTKQWVRISLNPKRSYCSSKQILYFCIILLREFNGEWYDIVVFDTYHQGKQYPHGHRRIGTSDTKEEIKVPLFDNFKESILWVYDYLNKNWHNYVTMFYNDIKKRRKIK